MASFLSSLVDACVAENLIQADTIIVLPNQRARRLLIDELSKRQDLPKPLFIPEILSVEHFVEKLSPLRKADPLELLMNLYEVYAPKSKKEDKFNDFMRWADTFIKDVSDMEMQMQNVPLILREVAADKDFEFRIGQDSLSASQRDTVSFYGMLEQLHEEYNQLLLNRKIGYPGLLYRNCAEHIEQYASKLTCKHIVFAGLFVLTISEQKMFQYLQSRFDTHFYFDVDPFYCDFDREPIFSTSYFLKQLCDKFALNNKTLRFQNSDYASIKKEVEIIGVNGQMSQIYYAVQYLEELKNNCPEALDDTVVVLADESMLVPFLKAYDTSSANVTMGIPFSISHAYMLVCDLLNLYQYGISQVPADRETALPFCHPILTQLMSNPLINYLMPQDPMDFREASGRLQQRLSAKNVFFAPATEEFAALLPQFTSRPSHLLPQLLSYLERLKAAIPTKDKEHYVVSDVIEVLQNVHQALGVVYDQDLTFVAVRNMVRRQLDSLKFSLEGNASQGLQVMGLLETRALDFKNIVMLGVNEGVIPQPVRYNSLLPFNHKYAGIDLPNYIYHDKIFAYHFFRLLQRAEHVTLMFDTAGKTNVGEKSRFVSQLEFEAAHQHLDTITFQYHTIAYPLTTAASDIAVPKTPTVMERLSQYEFSASSLNDYINCPLSFYLKDLCKIRKPDTPDDTLQTNTIGTLVHASLQHIFEKMKHEGRYVATLQSMLKDESNLAAQYILPVVQEYLALSEQELQKGRFLILTEIVQSHVMAYLHQAVKEFQDGDVTLLSFEDLLACAYSFGDKTIRLKGFVDRLQKKGAHLMVLDYKTGSVKEEEMKVPDKNMSEVFTNPKYAKLVQLFVYALLCKYTDNEVVKQERDRGVFDPICGIISTKECLKSNKKYLYSMQYNGQDYFDDELLQIFEQAFQELMDQILDSKVPFTQANKAENCKYCDFKAICRR